MDTMISLKGAMDADKYVRVTIEGESHEGFIVGLSPTLVLVQVVRDFSDAGAVVFPVAAVESCEVSDHHDDQLKIIAFNSVKRTQRYKWVKLGSYADLFRSLLPKKRFVVLSFGDEADVGLIEDVGEDSVDLKAVDPGGNWTGDTLECPLDELTSVAFDDNYSRVLQRYVERAPALN